MPGLTPVRIPVNPGDAIAMVNNQSITRQQLADECLAREGKKVLELLINRTLIDQALPARKWRSRQRKSIRRSNRSPAVSESPVKAGSGRSIRNAASARSSTPATSSILPSRLRKLSSGRVQVTPDDLKKAFEAQYGEKLRCRMIMVDKQSTAIAIWEQLRRTPAGFEKIAQEQSMDSASRSLGGLVGEPITRHAYPQTLSDAAFYQLVDGDPADHDPSHKPKDGDFTGPIQVGEAVWVILRRESVVAAARRCKPQGSPRGQRRPAS